jgi:hypothetical protein
MHAVKKCRGLRELSRLGEMSSGERFTLILSTIGVIGIPTLAFVVRATIKWTRVEDKLEIIANKLLDIVKDKDETHREMLQQMREDRNATNLRLRWLEENIWRRRRGNTPQ